MKFFEGFFGLLAVAAGLLYAGFNILIHALLNGAMVVFGALLLVLDLFALAIWLVNWKYYPESSK